MYLVSLKLIVSFKTKILIMFNGNAVDLSLGSGDSNVLLNEFNPKRSIFSSLE